MERPRRYYALFSPLEGFYHGMVIPYAVFDSLTTSGYKARIGDSLTTIKPSDVAFTRLRLDEYDPRNRVFEAHGSPVMGVQPMIIRRRLNKARTRDLIKKRFPTILQPRHWGIEILEKGTESRVKNSDARDLKEIENQVRSGQVMYLKPWDGWSGKAVVRVERLMERKGGVEVRLYDVNDPNNHVRIGPAENGRLYVRHYKGDEWQSGYTHTPSKIHETIQHALQKAGLTRRKLVASWEQNGLRFTTSDTDVGNGFCAKLAELGASDKAITVQEFIDNVYLPIVKHRAYPAYVGGLIVEHEIPSLGKNKSEIRFLCFQNKVAAHYAKQGGPIVANIAEGGEGAPAEKLVRQLLAGKVPEERILRMTREFLEEARKTVERMAREFHKEALRYNFTAEARYPPEKLSLDEIAVDVAPHFDEKTHELKPVLVEINNGRIALRGLLQSNPQTYWRVMRLRQERAEQLFLHEVARREGRDGPFKNQDEAKKYLNAAHEFIKSTAISRNTANGNLVLRPQKGYALELKQLLRRMGFAHRARKNPVPHQQFSSIVYEIQPTDVQKKKIERALELFSH